MVRLKVENGFGGGESVGKRRGRYVKEGEKKRLERGEKRGVRQCSMQRDRRE
mgnify:CR=1 FL=1